MADDVDIANDLILANLEARIAAARKPVQEGPEECEECGEPMPALRRRLGLKMCVDCAGIAERRQKLGLRS